MITNITLFLHKKDKIEVLNGGFGWPVYIRVNIGEAYIHLNNVTQIKTLIADLVNIVDGIEFREYNKEVTNAEVKE